MEKAQVEALKKGFDSFDKEQVGSISGTAMQMIFKMMGVTVQKTALDEAIGKNQIWFQVKSYSSYQCSFFAIGELVDQPADSTKFEFTSFCQVKAKNNR